MSLPLFFILPIHAPARHLSSKVWRFLRWPAEFRPSLIWFGLHGVHFGRAFIWNWPLALTCWGISVPKQPPDSWVGEAVAPLPGTYVCPSASSHWVLPTVLPAQLRDLPSFPSPLCGIPGSLTLKSVVGACSHNVFDQRAIMITISKRKDPKCGELWVSVVHTWKLLQEW